MVSARCRAGFLRETKPHADHAGRRVAFGKLTELLDLIGILGIASVAAGDRFKRHTLLAVAAL
jgi:hypothetical protein